MSHLRSSFVPAGVGFGRAAAGLGVMVAGAVPAFHGLGDSAPWLPSFMGSGDTLAGGAVFVAGLMLVLLPAAGRRRPRAEAPPLTRFETSERSVDTKGLEALIKWDEEVSGASANAPPPLPPRPEPVGSSRDFSADTPHRP